MFGKKLIFGGMAAAVLFAGSVSFAQANHEDDHEDSEDIPAAAMTNFDSDNDSEDVAATALSGYGPKKIKICHKGKTITIPLSALPAHLAHGDTIGKCPPKPILVTICHKGTTLQIPIGDAWRHMAHGDHTGKCRPKLLGWYYGWQGGGWNWPRFSWGG